MDNGTVSVAVAAQVLTGLDIGLAFLGLGICAALVILSIGLAGYVETIAEVKRREALRDDTP